MQLTSWMKRAKMKRPALAKALGVDLSTVCRYISGKKIPSPKMAKKIVEVTEKKVTLSDLYSAVPAAKRHESTTRRAA